MKIKGFRTFGINSLVVLAGAFAFLAEVDMPDGVSKWVIIGVGVANVVLRMITSTPVFKAEAVVKDE